MFRRFGPFTALAAGLLVLASVQAADKDKDDKKDDDPFADMIGKPAPDFSGDFAINGKITKISALKGKVVLLDFWAVWCGPCVGAFPHLRDLNDQFHDKGLEIIGVTKYYERFSYDKEKDELVKLDPDMKLNREDEQNMLKDFASHYKLDFRLMAVARDYTKDFDDDYKELDRDYKVRGIPETVLIDRKGLVRMVKLGNTEENTKAIHDMVEELVKEQG
jgi:thiol-disulfide isomerase/thioredoxin